MLLLAEDQITNIGTRLQYQDIHYIVAKEGAPYAYILCRQAHKVGRKSIREESTVPDGTEPYILPVFYRPIFPTENLTRPRFSYL